MINPKNIGIAAGVGFVLSFLIGIFSGIAFGRVLLRALLCALIFGALCAGISILFQKFLSDGQSDAVSDATVEKASKTVGGKVDITIDGDTLPEEEQGPRFDVGRTRTALRNSGLTAAVVQQPVAPAQARPAPVPQPAVQSAPASPAAEPAESAPVFKPMALTEATAPQTAAQAAPQSVAGQGTGGGVLDELPDISGFTDYEDKGSQQPDDESVVSDSDFASEGEAPAPKTARFSDGKPIEEQNASVMAQAIRTILAKN